MPIKPIYAERLINGSKFFEYRRRPISVNLTHIIIYASSPIKRILGIAKVDKVHIAKPAETWKATTSGAGITNDEFDIYFNGAALAYAIEIDPKSIIKLKREVKPAEIEPNFSVPQSFMYVSETFMHLVTAKGCC